MVRNAGLFNAKLLKFIQRANELRIVCGVAQAAQRNDGIEDAWVDRSQAIRFFKAIEHPPLRPLQRQLAQWTNVEALAEVDNAIQHQEEVAPGNLLFIPLEVQVFAVASAY